MMEKTLPHSTEAEKGILGAILIDPTALVQVADILHASDFYHLAHRTIYEVMRSLAASGKLCEFITVCDELERLDKLQDVGNASYLTGLINGCASPYGITTYADSVLDTALKRDIIADAGLNAADAFESESGLAALDKVEERLFKLRQRRNQRTEAQSLSELSVPYIEKLEALHSQSGALVGVPTGYRVLNRKTGGWQKTDLVIIAARPGMGKTSLALCLADTAAMHGVGVGFYSLEMGKDQLYTRLLSMKTGIDSQRLRAGRIEDDEWSLIVKGRDALDSLPLWIDDTGGLSTTELRSRARRLCTEHSIGLLIVDYLGLLQAKNEQGKRYENRVQEVSEISMSLKGLAKELNVPVIALSQLSRAVESRQNKRPLLSDLRDSGSVEQDADIVLFLYRDSVYNAEPKDLKGNPVTDDYTELDIAKHRNGPLGDTHLYFDETHTRFTDEA